ncbi:MAG: glycine oxidase ThiO, partial [Nocardioidaceae bacterium]
MTARTRVCVVGAGIVGLACAEELLRAGHDVTIFDPAPGSGATHAAAGMLAPAGEAWFGEQDLLRLGLASRQAWPAYAARLGVAYQDAGTVLVGGDRGDLDRLTAGLDLLAAAGVEVRSLRRADLRALEPTLGGRLVGGALLPGDHSVDPRAVAAALLTAVGASLVRDTARPLLDGSRNGTCTGVLTGRGATYPADVVVVATGHRLDPMVPQHRLVRPVRGEVVRARTTDAPARTVRALVEGFPVYLVPRPGGEVVVGATTEEHPGRAAGVASLGGVHRLLDAARRVVPTLDDADLVEVTTRDRPGTPDNGPLLGPTGIPGLLVAAGHFRGGVLLAPATARALRAHVEGRAVEAEAACFTPERFAHDRPAGRPPDRSPLPDP